MVTGPVQPRSVNLKRPWGNCTGAATPTLLAPTKAAPSTKAHAAPPPLMLAVAVPVPVAVGPENVVTER